MKNMKFLIALLLLLAQIHVKAQTWFPIASGTSKNLNSIHFPSANVGYICGDDSLLLKTTDGGLTWNPINFSGINLTGWNNNILNLQFLTDSIGYLTAGPYSDTYKTVDGGLNWTVNASVGANCYNQGMFFFDADNGFIGGSGCFQGELIERLANGIWTPATMNSPTGNSSNLIVDIDFYNAQLGLAASAGGLIFRTSDGGLNWDSISVTPDLNPLTSVLMVNDTLAYAGYISLSLGFGLYISTDGGLTWAQDLNSATFFYPDFLALHKSGDGKIYSGGFSQGSATGLIFSSPGDVITWNYDQVTQSINSISSYNDSIVFAVGDSGLIVVNKTLTSLPVFELSPAALHIDIFPNPAHHSIQLTLPNGIESKGAVVSIYSLAGQLISINPLKGSIDISTLAAGEYIIEVLSANKRAVGKFLVK